MTVFASICILLSLHWHLSARLGGGCETFWDTDPLTDSCYQFNFQASLSWREARVSCQQQGADLLSVTKLHEQTYINGLLTTFESFTPQMTWRKYPVGGQTACPRQLPLRPLRWCWVSSPPPIYDTFYDLQWNSSSSQSSCVSFHFTVNFFMILFY